jgi:hypothetical protein
MEVSTVEEKPERNDDFEIEFSIFYEPTEPGGGFPIGNSALEMKPSVNGLGFEVSINVVELIGLMLRGYNVTASMIYGHPMITSNISGN